MLYAIMLLIYMTLGVIKVSFILLYRRIFVTSPFHLVCNIMIGVFTGWAVALVIVSFSSHQV